MAAGRPLVAVLCAKAALNAGRSPVAGGLRSGTGASEGAELCRRLTVYIQVRAVLELAFLHTPRGELAGVRCCTRAL